MLSGLLPCVSHCLTHLMLPEAVVIPAAATIYAQASEIITAPVCGGLQLSALDSYRCVCFVCVCVIWEREVHTGRAVA